MAGVYGIRIEDRTGPGAASARRSFQSVSDAAAGTSRQLDAFQSNMGAANTGALSLARGLAGPVGLAVAAGSVVSALAAATARAVAFQTAMAEVATVLPADTKELGALAEKVQDVTRQFGGDAPREAKALYEILSAGITDTAQATEVLTAANNLAIGGMTDVATAADGLTSILNSWGSEAGNVTQVTDAMFLAMAAGKTTIGEIAESISFVGAVAATTGVSLQEILSATAALSLGGVPTTRAMRGLAQVIAAIIKPSSEAEKEAKRLKLQFDAAALSSKGLIGFLRDLRTATHGNSTSLALLFGGVEAIVPVMQLAGNQAQAFADILRQMETQSGQTAEAVGKITRTDAFALKQATAEWESFTQTVGDLILTNILGPLARSGSAAIQAARAAGAGVSPEGQVTRSRWSFGSYQPGWRSGTEQLLSAATLGLYQPTGALQQQVAREQAMGRGPTGQPTWFGQAGQLGMSPEQIRAANAKVQAEQEAELARQQEAARKKREADEEAAEEAEKEAKARARIAKEYQREADLLARVLRSGAGGYGAKGKTAGAQSFVGRQILGQVPVFPDLSSYFDDLFAEMEAMDKELKGRARQLAISRAPSEAARLGIMHGAEQEEYLRRGAGTAQMAELQRLQAEEKQIARTNDLVGNVQRLTTAFAGMDTGLDRVLTSVNAFAQAAKAAQNQDAIGAISAGLTALFSLVGATQTPMERLLRSLSEVQKATDAAAEALGHYAASLQDQTRTQLQSTIRAAGQVLGLMNLAQPTPSMLAGLEVRGRLPGSAVGIPELMTGISRLRSGGTGEVLRLLFGDTDLDAFQSFFQRTIGAMAGWDAQAMAQHLTELTHALTAFDLATQAGYEAMGAASIAAQEQLSGFGAVLTNTFTGALEAYRHQRTLQSPETARALQAIMSQAFARVATIDFGTGAFAPLIELTTREYMDLEEMIAEARVYAAQRATGKLIAGYASEEERLTAMRFRAEEIAAQSAFSQSYQRAGRDVFAQRQAYGEYQRVLGVIREQSGLAGSRTGVGRTPIAAPVTGGGTTEPPGGRPVVEVGNIPPMTVDAGSVVQLTQTLVDQWTQLFDFAWPQPLSPPVRTGIEGVATSDRDLIRLQRMVVDEWSDLYSFAMPSPLASVRTGIIGVSTSDRDILRLERMVLDDWSDWFSAPTLPAALEPVRTGVDGVSTSNRDILRLERMVLDDWSDWFSAPTLPAALEPVRTGVDSVSTSNRDILRLERMVLDDWSDWFSAPTLPAVLEPVRTGVDSVSTSNRDILRLVRYRLAAWSDWFNIPGLPEPLAPAKTGVEGVSKSGRDILRLERMTLDDWSDWFIAPYLPEVLAPTRTGVIGVRTSDRDILRLERMTLDDWSDWFIAPDLPGQLSPAYTAVEGNTSPPIPSDRIILSLHKYRLASWSDWFDAPALPAPLEPAYTAVEGNTLPPIPADRTILSLRRYALRSWSDWFSAPVLPAPLEPAYTAVEGNTMPAIPSDRILLSLRKYRLASWSDLFNFPALPAPLQIGALDLLGSTLDVSGWSPTIIPARIPVSSLITLTNPSATPGGAPSVLDLSHPATQTAIVMFINGAIRDGRIKGVLRS